MPAYAIVRVKGTRRINVAVKDTLASLRLTRANHCVVLPQTPEVQGQLQHVKDYVTFGTVEAKEIATLIRTRGRLEGDAPVTDAAVAAGSPFKSIDEFAAAIAAGKVRYGSLKGVTPIFRLAPPRQGYKGGIKRAVKAHGNLGDRGATMNKLIERMI